MFRSFKRFLCVVFFSILMVPTISASALQLTDLQPNFSDSEALENNVPPTDGYDFEFTAYENDQIVEYTATVTNDEEYDIKVTNITLNTPENDFLEYSYSGIEINDVIAVGESREIITKVTINDLDTITASEDYRLGIDYELIVPPDVEPENVDTSDPITFVVVGSMLSGVVGFLLLRKNFRRRHFVILFAISASALALSANGFAEETKNFTILGRVNFINVYTVTIDPDGGIYDGKTSPTQMRVLDGEKIHVGEATRETYNFIEWEVNPGELDSNNDIVIVSDTYIKAIWDEVYYTLTILPNGGKYKGIEGTVTERYRPGFDAPLETPAKIGAQFTNWTRDGSSTYTGSTIKMNSDVTLLANYEALKYHVIINPNGGKFNGNTAVFEDDVEYGTDIDVTDIAYDNHVFKSWTKNNVDTLPPSTESIHVTDDIRLDAVWNEIFTVTIDPNGGKYDGKTGLSYYQVEGGETYTMLEATRDDDYGLTKWVMNGTTDFTGDSFVVEGDTTLRAEWFLAVARIERTGKLYPSIMAAHEEANPGDIRGDVITLLRDTAEVVTNEKQVTLDLNFHTVTGSLTNTLAGDITLINGEINNPDGAAVTNNGILTMGINDYGDDDKPLISRDNIRLIGTDTGLKQNATFNFYDGFIEGDIGLDGGYNDSPRYREAFDGRWVKYFPFVSHNNIKDCQHVELENADRAVTKTIENGEIYYYNVQDNVDASARTGYKMYAIRDFDASYPVTIADGDDIEFDIAGYHPNMADVWTVNGKLTISDTGHDEVTDEGDISFTKSLANNGELVMTGATIKNGSDFPTVKNSGSISLQSSTIQSDSCYALEVTQDGSTVTMDNDSYIKSTSTTCHAIYNSSADFTIRNGHVLGVNYGAIRNVGTFTVSGGEVKADTDAGCVVWNDSTFKITGGEVIGEAAAPNRTFIGVCGGTTNISGGKLSVINNQENNWESSAVGVSGALEMSGGEIYTESHGGPFSAANGAGSIGHYYDITGGTITSKGIGGSASAFGVFCAGNSLSSNCSGDISGATINVYSENDTAGGMGNAHERSNIGANTTINASTKNGRAYGILNGDGSNFEITGATINATVVEGGTSTDAYGIHGSEIIIINDGTVVNGQYVGIKDSNATVKGGTVRGGTYGIDSPSRTITIGMLDDSISITNPVVEGGTYGIKDGNYNFYDGVIKGGEHAYESRDNIKAIPDGAEYHLDPKEGSDATEDLWLVEGDDFLEVNGTPYNSFTKAYNAVSNGGTVKVIANKTTEGVIPTNYKNIILDLNNCVLTLSQTVPNDASMIITDNSQAKGGKIVNNNNQIAVKSTGPLLQLDGGEISSTRIAVEAANDPYEENKFVMNGGTARAEANDSDAVNTVSGITAVEMNGGMVVAKNTGSGEANAFSGDGDKIINDGTVTVNSNTSVARAFSDGYVEVNGGTLNIKSENGDAVGHYSYWSHKFKMTGGEMNITGKTGAAGTAQYNGNTVDFFGGTINVTADGSASGINSTTTEMRSGATLTVTSHDGNAYGITGDSRLTMTGGEINVHIGDSSMTAYGVTKYEATITGGKVSADTYGISNSGNNIIGTVSDPLEIANPEIYGGTNAIKEGSYSFYGGILKGGEQAYEDLSRIKAITDGAEYHHETKSGTHETDDLWLVATSNYLEVNGEELNSFTKAYSKVADGGTIKVIADKATEADIPTNPDGRTVTIDLNGHTLSLSKSLPNNGIMTITDNGNGSGVIENINQSCTPTIRNNDTLTINKGKILNHCTAIESKSTDGRTVKLTLSGVAKVKVTQDGTSANLTGIDSTAEVTIKEDAEITVSNSGNGTSLGVLASQTNLRNGTVSVTTSGDGVMTGVSGSLAMTGGTIDVDAKGNGDAGGLRTESGGRVEISGGEVKVSTKGGNAVGYSNYEYGSSSYTGGKIDVKSTDGEAHGLSLGEHTIDISNNFVLEVHSDSKIAVGVAHDGGWGSALNMYGGSINVTSNSDDSCGVRVANPKIYGGEIYAGKNAIETSDEYNPGEGVIIGTKGEGLSTTSPVIRGGEYAVYGENIYFYDGVLYGGTAAYIRPQSINAIETDTVIVSDTETIDSVSYQKRYLGANHEVAQITTGGVTTKYTSITNAIAAAHNGDTIELLENNYAYEGFTIPASLEVTIDLKGFNIVMSAPIVNNGDLTMVNNGADVLLDYYKSNYFIQNGSQASLELNGMNISAQKAIESGDGSTLIINGSTLAQKSGTTEDFITSSGNVEIRNSAVIDAISTAVHVGTGDLTINTSAKIESDDMAVWFGGNQLTIDGATINAAKTAVYQASAVVKSEIKGSSTLNNRVYVGAGDMSLKSSTIKNSNGDPTIKLINTESGTTVDIDSCTIELTTSDSYVSGYGEEYNSVVKNAGSMTIKDSTIKLVTAENGNINNNYAVFNTGTLDISGTPITVASENTNIYCDQIGILVRDGSVVLHNNAVSVTGATVYGIKIDSGEFTMGDAMSQDDPFYGLDGADKTDPSIRAIGTNAGTGIENHSRFNYYDGVITGSTTSLTPTVPTNIEYLYEVKFTTDSDGYMRAELDYMRAPNN